MADPHDDPALVEAIISPSAGQQLPDPPDTGGGMESEGEKENSSCKENAGCSGDGEGGMEVTSPSSDCTMPAAESSAGAKADKENVAHDSAPPALVPPASFHAPEDGAAPLAGPATEDGAAPLAGPATEDGATPASPAPEDEAGPPTPEDCAGPPVPVACTEGATSDVTSDDDWTTDDDVTSDDDAPPAPEDWAGPPVPVASTEGVVSGIPSVDDVTTDDDVLSDDDAPPAPEIVLAACTDCKIPAADSQDCASAGAVVDEGNATHGNAFTALASEDGATPPASSPALEDWAGPRVPIPVPEILSEGAASRVFSNHQLAKADPDGAWFKAIEARDSLSLMNILKAQKDDSSRLSLCSKTGEQGRTALHVAAMQGCFRLAKQLIDLVCEGYPFTHDDHVKNVFPKKGDITTSYGVHLSPKAYEFIYGEDGRSGLSMFEMANDIIGNTSISQYILYMGRDPKDGEHLGIMYEAYEGTHWQKALARRDCPKLRLLLNYNSRCLLETCGGLSVLDVAILKGDEKLVKEVMGLFRAATTGPEICWNKESYFPSEVRWEQIAKRSASVESAKLDCLPSIKSRKHLQSVESISQLAEKFGRSEVIKKLLQNVEEHVQGSGEGAGEDRYQDLSRDLPAAGLFKNDVGSSPTRDGEHVPSESDLESEVGERDEHLFWAEKIEDCWNPEWTAGFMADVDYNFEEGDPLRLSILRLHYAFKHPRLCSSFLDEALLPRIISEKELFPSLIYDGQGRTAFHTMVDYYNPNEFTFDELNIYALRLIHGSTSDSRGRSTMIRALTKQFLEPETMVSSHYFQFYQEEERRFNKESIEYEKLRGQSQNNDFSMFQGLFLASFLYKDVDVLRLLTSKEEHKNEIKDFMNTVHVNSSRYEVPHNRALFIAAGSGNQTLLREWFKFKFDCMVEDEKGKTALHYAADANSLEFMSPPTSFFCLIDYPKKVKEEWTKRRKAERANLNVGQDILNGSPQSESASVGRQACILMLLQAGVHLSQVDKEGNIPDPGASNDTEFQKWWYNLSVKDSEDKKNSFNQAGNALSVVGTLVAATSYIGPLQPPLSYSEHNGYVDTSRSLVKVFMWTNTLAFYLALASVMFAVVPSLPMPQEGVIDELRRARHTVSSLLFLLLASIGCILVSFASATAVVVDNGDYYGTNDFLLSPSVIGWFFCMIAMVSFFIRVMRLVFYKNPTTRQIYKFSFSAFIKGSFSAFMKRSGKLYIARNLRKITGLLVFYVLVVPMLILERGLIWMHGGLGRLWKEQASSSASPEVDRRPYGPIMKLVSLDYMPYGPVSKLADRLGTWVEDSNAKSYSLGNLY